jgi:hypothetical protein
MSDRESKLPVWARDALRTLRQQNTELQSALNIARGEASNSATGVVIADCYSGRPFPLPDRAAIEFEVEGGKVRVMIRDGILDINGGGPLVVLPHAANSIYIKVRER